MNRNFLLKLRTQMELDVGTLKKRHNKGHDTVHSVDGVKNRLQNQSIWKLDSNHWGFVLKLSESLFTLL